MDEPMTKAKLIDLLKSRRAEFDAALAEIAESSMTEAGAAGYWSVKDIVAHMAHYEGWMADRMHEQLEGKIYIPDELDMMHFEPRNTIIYERHKSRALDDVLRSSTETFGRLMAAVEAHSEEFLIQPQTFYGAPAPIVVADMLRSEVYDHYPQHIPSLKAWAAAHPK